jgi:hypothetical protein
VGRQPSELEQLVALQTLGQRDRVEVVVAVDRGTERLEVLLLDEQVRESVIDLCGRVVSFQNGRR